MKVGLFIPCYIDQFYPEVARATLELLESFGVEVGFPTNQTCCGQPLANSGFEEMTLKMAEQYEKIFNSFDYIVAPSGSCVYHVRHHYNILPDNANNQRVRNITYELCEFIVKILHEPIDAFFPHRVGLHQSCHGLRGLGLGNPSEMVNDNGYDLVTNLINQVTGLELIDLEKSDECCGFGGSFAVMEEAVSVKMGNDRLKDHVDNKATYITATDMSCLMHLDGLIKRGNLPVKTIHIAQILNSKKS